MIPWCVVYSWGRATVLTTWPHVILITPNLTTCMSVFFIIHQRRIWIYSVAGMRQWLCRDVSGRPATIGARQPRPGVTQAAVCPASRAGRRGRGAGVWPGCSHSLSCGTSGEMTWKQPVSQRKHHPTSPFPPADGAVAGTAGTPKSHFRSRLAWEDSWESSDAHWVLRRPAALPGFCGDGDSSCVQTAAFKCDRSGRTQF